MKKVLAIAAVPALFAAGLLTGKIISDKKHDDEGNVISFRHTETENQ